MLAITLPCLPPKEYSANNSRGRHWSEKQKITQAAHDEIIAAVRAQGWHGEPLTKAVVKITFGLPDHRKRDSGGLIERCKPWLDGLVDAGVIADDDLETIGWPEYSHFYSLRNPITKIEVKDGPGRR